MAYPYFIFKNKDSREYNIIINKLPPIPTFSNEVELKEVPGRDGYLTIDLERRKAVDLTTEITIFPDDYLEEIMGWLRGSGKVTFSNQPNIFYQARVESVREFIGAKKDKTASIIFHCQPFGYLDSGDNSINITTKNTTIINKHSETKPLIKLFGSGAGEVIINNQKMIFENVSSVTMDSELQESYNSTNEVFFKGKYPVLKKGDNVINWNGGITRLEVIPRWRK